MSTSVRASIARTGRLPVALGDGVSFTVRSDDNGKLLDGRCDIVLSGITPAARFWTLTLYNPDWALVANSTNRYGFTSQEIIKKTVDAMLERLSILRSQMLPPLPAPNKRN